MAVFPLSSWVVQHLTTPFIWISSITGLLSFIISGALLFWCIVHFIHLRRENSRVELAGYWPLIITTCLIPFFNALLGLIFGLFLSSHSLLYLFPNSIFSFGINNNNQLCRYSFCVALFMFCATKTCMYLLFTYRLSAVFNGSVLQYKESVLNVFRLILFVSNILLFLLWLYIIYPYLKTAQFADQWSSSVTCLPSTIPTNFSFVILIITASDLLWSVVPLILFLYKMSQLVMVEAAHSNHKFRNNPNDELLRVMRKTTLLMFVSIITTAVYFLSGFISPIFLFWMPFDGLINTICVSLLYGYTHKLYRCLCAKLEQCCCFICCSDFCGVMCFGYCCLICCCQCFKEEASMMNTRCFCKFLHSSPEKALVRDPVKSMISQHTRTRSIHSLNEEQLHMIFKEDEHNHLCQKCCACACARGCVNDNNTCHCLKRHRRLSSLQSAQRDRHRSKHKKHSVQLKPIQKKKKKKKMVAMKGKLTTDAIPMPAERVLSASERDSDEEVSDDTRTLDTLHEDIKFDGLSGSGTLTTLHSSGSGASSMSSPPFMENANASGSGTSANTTYTMPLQRIDTESQINESNALSMENSDFIRMRKGTVIEKIATAGQRNKKLMGF